MNHKLLCLIPIALAACAEVRGTDAGRTDVPTGTDTPMLADVPSSSDVPALDTPGLDAPLSDTPGADAPVTGNVVVINEINPDSPDFVELLNAGTTPLSLDGLSIIDSDDTHTAVAFPAGTTLAPGQRFIVAFQVTCPDAPPAGLGLTERCVATDFGIGGGGDTIRIRDGAGAEIVSVVFPGGLATDQSYCRLPDGTGDFAACDITLDAVNAPPP